MPEEPRLFSAAVKVVVWFVVLAALAALSLVALEIAMDVFFDAPSRPQPTGIYPAVPVNPSE